MSLLNKWAVSNDWRCTWITDLADRDSCIGNYQEKELSVITVQMKKMNLSFQIRKIHPPALKTSRRWCQLTPSSKGEHLWTVIFLRSGPLLQWLTQSVAQITLATAGYTLPREQWVTWLHGSVSSATRLSLSGLLYKCTRVPLHRPNLSSADNAAAHLTVLRNCGHM